MHSNDYRILDRFNHDMLMQRRNIEYDFYMSIISLFYHRSAHSIVSKRTESVIAIITIQTLYLIYKRKI